MNRTVRIDNSHDLKVTGVLKDLPSNSTFQIKFIVPIAYATQNYDWVKSNLTNWRDKSFQTFVALQSNVSYARVESQLKSLLRKYSPEDYKLWKVEAFMQPMKDWHLYTRFENGIAVGGFIDYVRMFNIIGILVLLIACINFMNLSTARSEKRAREVGIRKAVGSQRWSLIFKFLIEDVVI